MNPHFRLPGERNRGDRTVPLNQYHCRDCEEDFEYLQPMNARAKRKCENCGGRLEKAVPRAGFVLKGGG